MLFDATKINQSERKSTTKVNLITKENGIALRLKEVVHSKGLKDNAFARSIGISQSAFNKILHGGGISVETALSVSDNHSISIEWLLTGCGSKDKNSKVLHNGQFTTEVNVVQVVPQRVQAGHLAGYADFDPETVSIVVPGLRVRNPLGFTISGDSMEPTLSEGNILVCSQIPPADVRDNYIYIIETRDEGMQVKRLVNQLTQNAQLVLRSDNLNYPPVILSAEDLVGVWQIHCVVTKNLTGPDALQNRISQLERVVYDLVGEKTH